MFSSQGISTITLARNRYDIFDLIRDLRSGDDTAWYALAIVFGCITFFVLYRKITGKDFVKSRKERREARKRRKHVIWEYSRDK